MNEKIIYCFIELCMTLGLTKKSIFAVTDSYNMNDSGDLNDLSHEEISAIPIYTFEENGQKILSDKDASFFLDMEQEQMFPNS